MFGSATYLWVNVAVIIFPFLLSFDKKVAFYKQWKAFGLATLGTMAVFIPWDVWFTASGVWGFNDTYLLGPRLFGLPVEEWLFFITIPYACTFSYACFKAYLPKGMKKGAIANLHMAAILIFAAIPIVQFAVTGSWHAYTLSASILACVLSLLHRFVIRKPYVGWFYLAYPILVIPFLIANGVLTGLDFWHYTFWNTTPEMVSDQVVWYNNAENLGVRTWSVPVDDFVYGYGLILLNVTLFERFTTR